MVLAHVFAPLASSGPVPHPARKAGRRPAARLHLERLESRELLTGPIALDQAAGVAVTSTVHAVLHNNSADRAILWNGAWNVAALTDAELDAWARRGIDGFVLQVGWLAGGLGGTQ